MSNDDDALMRRISDTLDRQARDDEQRHAFRLDRARREALAAGAGRERRRTFIWPMLATTGLAAVVVTLGVMHSGPERGVADPPPVTDDLDLLTSPAFDLALNDVAFYEWMAEQAPADGREASG